MRMFLRKGSSMKRVAGALLVSILVAACSSASDPAARDLSTSQEPLGQGAIVGVTMDSSVGVLLDEVPADMRDRAAAAILAKPASFWEARAQRQIQLMTYRLVFREFFYKSRSARQALPLPPAEIRHVTLKGTAKRVHTQTHDTIQIDYAFNGTLLTDPGSPGASEPNLANVGGTWDEPA